MSQSGYSRIEQDEVEVSHQRLEQIAKALDLTVQDILNFDEKQIFNVMHNQTGSGISNNYYQFTEDMKKLYEEQIKVHKEQNQLLTDLVALLKEEIERLKKGK